MPAEQPAVAQEVIEVDKQTPALPCKVEQDAPTVQKRDLVRPGPGTKSKKARVKKESTAAEILPQAPDKPAKRKRDRAQKTTGATQDAPTKKRKSKTKAVKSKAQSACDTPGSSASAGPSMTQTTSRRTDAGDASMAKAHLVSVRGDSCMLMCRYIVESLMSVFSGDVRWKEDGFERMELSAFSWMAPVRHLTA